MGLPLTVIRNHDPEGAIRDPDQIRPSVLAWRQGLSQALQERLAELLDWNENQQATYFTDKPAWDCYADLMLWAAYSSWKISTTGNGRPALIGSTGGRSTQAKTERVWKPGPALLSLSS